MTSLSKDLSLKDELIYVGLLSCFKKGERSLCTTRLLARRYTSHRISDLVFLKALHSLDLIELVKAPHTRNNLVKGIDYEVTLLQDQKTNSTAQRLLTTSRIQEKIKENNSVLNELDDLLLSLLAAECMEYASFYAQRRGRVVKVNNASFQILKIMLQFCSVGQVNMLIWRAVKNIPQSRSSTDIDLTDILSLAKSYYVEYVRQGTNIAHYERLRSAKPSELYTLLIFEVLGFKSDDSSLIGPISYWKEFR